ncbi:MAG: hypothetical protein IKU78_05105 [Paludibacteraceae bacterium]|nr:hypothetical protein [Paludibacteraceae bacterium]
MKKLILLLVLISTFGLASAEKIFCEVCFLKRYENVSNVVYMDIDMGDYISYSERNNAFLNHFIGKQGATEELLERIPETRAVDSNGKELTFYGVIDALNYISKLGWELEFVRNGQFYLFSKEKDSLRDDDLCPYVRWKNKNKK